MYNLCIILRDLVETLKEMLQVLKEMEPKRRGTK